MTTFWVLCLVLLSFAVGALWGAASVWYVYTQPGDITIAENTYTGGIAPDHPYRGGIIYGVREVRKP